DCATNLSGQLVLQVIGDKNGEDPVVYFKFFNNIGNPGGSQSSITQISFDGISDLTFLHPIIGSDPMRGTGTGTEFQFSFHGGGSIADTLLTGPGVTFNADWTARSVGAGNGGNGGVANGLNEQGDVMEMINAGAVHPDYLSFLHAIQNGDIRVGVVTEGYANGLSATYVTNVVPEPGIYAMLAIGLIAVGAVTRRNI
ncbi:MAG: PEP-CTERM sorting domain-containing protein, partial [Betaproteobacteria bacterium]